MPSLREFASQTGMPRMRRWRDMYEAVRELVTRRRQSDASSAPPQALLDLIKQTAVQVRSREVISAVYDSGLRRLRPMLLDATFTALPMSTWQAILKWSDVDRVRYVASRRDCDNFALALSGQVSLRLAVNGCGVVVDYSGCHAYCCLLVADGDDLQVVLCEPQSDGLPKAGDTLSGHEAYKAEQGFILFA